MDPFISVFVMNRYFRFILLSMWKFLMTAVVLESHTECTDLHNCGRTAGNMSKSRIYQEIVCT